MRVAIVADEGDESGERRELYLTQIGALIRRARSEDAIEPFVVCPRGSSVADLARDEAIPCLLAASAGNPIRTFKLWRWQRSAEKLGVLIVGKRALGVGRGLLKLRGKRETDLSFAFFMDAPGSEAREIRFLSRGREFFCGTGRIVGEIRAAMGDEAKFRSVAPGIDAASYSVARVRDNADYNDDFHFAFGMAASLLPRSGALLVIRAMAALWQKENLPPWEVRMFGEGPRYAEILREAGSLGVMSRLSILGDQPLSEVCAFCDGWIAPGASEEETPQVLWSGVAAELPLICSVNPLHMERLPSDASALWIEENDPQKLAKAMIDVLSSPEARRKMSAGMKAIKYLTSAEYMAKTVCAALTGNGDAADRTEDFK
ncbi:MAG: glycosyltransferase family 4 protein [Desulfovibrio sp.]|nr:glycosyltransferase family 4 protein [Desulfovibrio sp.]